MNFEWVVHLKDNRCVFQYDPYTKQEIKWNDAYLSDATKIGWYPYVESSDKLMILPSPHFELALYDHVKPLIFRRNNISFNNRGVTGDKEVRYVLGYEFDKRRCIMMISENGNVVMSLD